MTQVTLPSISSLEALVGQEVAVGDWLTLTQDRIDRFAEATGDHQWIHVDPARAKAESPYGSTIAHGFLTLSLLSAMLQQTVDITGARMGINYGLNRVRFTAPVPVGARIRARFRLSGFEPVQGGAQFTWAVTVEREGEVKPVLVAEWLTRRFD